MKFKETTKQELSENEIKVLYFLICKHDIKTITITETEDKTKTIFINYEN